MLIQRSFLSNLYKNLCCGCSLESPRRGDSNEYPQHRFLLRNKQNYHLIIIKYHQIRTLFLLLIAYRRLSRFSYQYNDCYDLTGESTLPVLLEKSELHFHHKIMLGFNIMAIKLMIICDITLFGTKSGSEILDCLIFGVLVYILCGLSRNRHC